jgi:hypothetical protein
MKLDDLLSKIANDNKEKETIRSDPGQSAQLLSAEVEKVASLLEVFAEEDTMSDQLAKLAVVTDYLRSQQNGKTSTI